MTASVYRAMGVARAAAVVLGLLIGGTVASSSSGGGIPTTTAVISTGAPAYVKSFQAPANDVLDVSLQDLALLSGNLLNLTALASLNLVVTANGAIVPQAGSTSSQATLSAPGTVSITATAGTTYEVRVVGVPAAGAATSNSISVGIASHSAGTSIASGTNTFQLPAAPVARPSYTAIRTLQLPAGTSTFTITDAQTPAPLTIFAFLRGPGLDATGTGTGTIQLPVGSTTRALPGGTYTLTLDAISDATALAGLFGLVVAPPSGTDPINETIPVGSWTLVGGAPYAIPSAESLTLTLTDLNAPASLQMAVAVVSSGGSLLGQATSGAPATFMVPAGQVSLWALVAPAAGNAGAYTLSLAPASGSAVYSQTSGVTDPASNLRVYPVNLTSAGNYTLAFSDLLFPQAFSTLTYQIYQAGASVAQGAAAAGIPAVALASGPTVLVATAVPGSGGDGVFSIALTGAGGTTPVFSQIQSVGPDLYAVPLAVPTTSNYDVSLADLGWPAKFSSLGGLLYQAAATQGAGFPVKLFGSATVPSAALAAGNYTVIVNGVPATGQTAGLYSLAFATSAPTVSLAAVPTAVTTGAGSRLSWSSTNATACTGTASGVAPSSSAFNGAQPTTGSVSDGPYSSAGTATYTLTCTGATGTATATATVTVSGNSTSSSGGGGGGGAFDLAGIGALAALGARRVRRRLLR